MKEDLSDGFSRKGFLKLRKAADTQNEGILSSSEDDLFHKASESAGAANREALKEELLRMSTRTALLDLNKELLDLFRRNLDTLLEREARYGSLDDEEKFKTECRAITRFYNVLSEFQEYIKNNYRNQLWVKGLYYPTKWMLNDPKISRACLRFRINDVLNYIDKNSMHIKDPKLKELAKGNKYDRFVKTGSKKGTKESTDYSVFLVNKAFYNEAESDLELKQISVQKYLKAFCDIGVLKKLGRTGAGNREMLYADGYVIGWKTDRKRKVRFLKESMKMGLQQFKL